MSSAARTELPIRVYVTPKGLVMACLCDAEAARLTLGTANMSMLGLRSSGPALHQAARDVSPGAVVVLAAHAEKCRTGLLRLDREHRAAAS